MSGSTAAKARSGIVFSKGFASCHSAKTFESYYKMWKKKTTIKTISTDKLPAARVSSQVHRSEAYLNFRSMIASSGKLTYSDLLSIVDKTREAEFRSLADYPFLVGTSVKKGEMVPKNAVKGQSIRRATLLFQPADLMKEGVEDEAIKKVIYALVSNEEKDSQAAWEHTIGSSTECDITMPDFAISARHACIALKNGKYTIFDLDSTNGTLVNWVKIPKEGARLENGDFIAFGRYEFMFLHPDKLHRALCERLGKFEIETKDVEGLSSETDGDN